MMQALARRCTALGPALQAACEAAAPDARSGVALPRLMRPFAAQPQPVEQPIIEAPVLQRGDMGASQACPLGLKRSCAVLFWRLCAARVLLHARELPTGAPGSTGCENLCIVHIVHMLQAYGPSITWQRCTACSVQHTRLSFLQLQHATATRAAQLPSMCPVVVNGLVQQHSIDQTPTGLKHMFKCAGPIKMKGIELAGVPMYLDMQATTPLDPRVLDAMMPFLSNTYGNPHSRTHMYGWESEDAVELARTQIAELIGALSWPSC